MHKESAFEGLPLRLNHLIVAALVLLTALAWLQIFRGSSAPVFGLHHVHHIHLNLGPSHTAPHSWNLQYLRVVFLMWVVMAIAMMLPTAAPAILSFADIARAGTRKETTTGRVAAFVFGYLLVWWGFGVLATVAQWRLTMAGLYLSAFRVERPLLGGAVLIGAGLYQFSTLKDACLRQCRSPMAFFLAHWRDGAHGAVYLGLRHGIDCVGCCWALMVLMLFSGTMSISWTAGLGALMLTEKIAPAGRTIARVAGVALVVCGGALLASGLFRGGVA